MSTLPIHAFCDIHPGGVDDLSAPSVHTPKIGGRVTTPSRGSRNAFNCVINLDFPNSNFRFLSAGSSQNNPQKSPCLQGEMPSPEVDVATPVTPTTPISPSDDSDERTGGQVSLSDSCANSFTESTGSLEDPC